MPKNLDEKLLESIGFATHDDLKAFIKKLNDFVDTLTPAEKKIFHANMKNCESAVRTFNFGVTQAQLRDFIGNSARNCDEYTCCLHGTMGSKRKKA